MTPSPSGDPIANAPAAPLLEVRGLAKSYPGVKALDQVDLQVRAGEIHALCGENGAGKSTLIKILGGVIPSGSYQGSFFLEGRECRFRGPRESLAGGVNIIFQELALAPDLSVAENVFLGREHAKGGWLDAHRMEAEAARQLAVLGMKDVAPTVPVRELSVGLRQMVEIARALASPARRILILDEPTSALSLKESQALLDVIVGLKSRGLGILYISHKLEEVFAVADRITVLRNGRSIETLDRRDAGKAKVISLMVGRKLEEVFPPRSPRPTLPASAYAPNSAGMSDAPLLRVRDWTVPSPVNPQVDILSGISFDLAAGEILGLAGLMGAGRTELVESLFGLGPRAVKGTIEITGRPYHPGGSGGPARAIARGIAMVPEDRRRHGLFLEKSIRENLTGACLERFSRLGQFIDADAEADTAARSLSEAGVKAPDAEFTAGFLSGGNQQKVVLAKWLLTKPRILFLDDPTRGVDVGAKADIYLLIQRLAAEGIGILLISSETEEVMHLSHRILVLRQGRLAGEFAGGAADPETILALSAGGATA
ncbi:MAG: sugar ABC transporter ATP-binding protein [Fibrobacteria bacterium]